MGRETVIEEFMRGEVLLEVNYLMYKYRNGRLMCKSIREAEWQLSNVRDFSTVLNNKHEVRILRG